VRPAPQTLRSVDVVVPLEFRWSRVTLKASELWSLFESRIWMNMVQLYELLYIVKKMLSHGCTGP